MEPVQIYQNEELSIDVFCKHKAEKTKLKHFTVTYHKGENQPITFFPSDVWINLQPAKSLMEFKFHLIKKEDYITHSIEHVNEHDELYLTLQSKEEIALEIIDGKATIPVNVHPSLTVSGFIVFLQKKLQLSDDNFKLKADGEYIQDLSDYLLSQLHLENNKKITIERLEKLDTTKGRLELGVRFSSCLKENFNSDIAGQFIKGLNLEGKCKNPTCELAFSKTAQLVYAKKGLGEFNMSQACPDATCPNLTCNTELTEVVNCVFWDCMFSVSGERKDGQPFDGIKDHRTARNSGISFDISSVDNIVKWRTLTISTQEAPFSFSDALPFVIPVVVVSVLLVGGYLLCKDKK